MTIDRSTCPATRHGTYVTYQRNSCRCPDAREDQRLYKKRAREGRNDKTRNITGTRRRIRALAALGWTMQHIGAAAGMTKAAVTIVSNSPRKYIYTATATKIMTAYEKLSGTPGPSPWARARAYKYGWAPPLAWDDDTIDDPSARPQTGMQRRISDRAIAHARRLAEKGGTQKQIMRQAGLPDTLARKVWREVNRPDQAAA